MAVGRKSYKGHKKGAGRHVQLPEYLQATEAWASLKPGPRALYIELKRRYNGSNNGQFFLSQRDAAKALNVTKDTVKGYFNDLTERGFITISQGGHLGPSGIGQAAKYALQEEPLHGKPAVKAFAAWRSKTETRPEKQDKPP